ncbi:TetR/AcrR family transcriptional regulator [Aldersonia sp. NBC_00410]|uniref:TetR/AcrR family transcriptional regulator n=1 Tax=Aldersonia sp. NBC_00410 TaxID=2975954 RepID=UPI00224FC938|nr:TetR/AcrR family transcriptional regulator [Aldersonia sp. NBC_00410]MCX5044407.1 TetR/AcrR family transcriptional regulator [Aldersonia sp. NBC_00410]
MENTPGPSRPGSKRAYDGSRRRASAQERHRRIVESGARLFVEYGFGATSINQIAADADVSPQTVYAAFGSKAAVLARAVDVAVAGDYDDVPMADRPQPWFDAEPTEVFGIAASLSLESNTRVGPLLRVVESAASTDPALEELRLRLIRALRSDCAGWLRRLPPGLLRADIDVDEAADAIAWFAGASTYMTFVADMGWSPQRYERWLADSYRRLLG